jgi:hypothetical protein
MAEFENMEHVGRTTNLLALSVNELQKRFDGGEKAVEKALELAKLTLDLHLSSLVRGDDKIGGSPQLEK